MKINKVLLLSSISAMLFYLMPINTAFATPACNATISPLTIPANTDTDITVTWTNNTGQDGNEAIIFPSLSPDGHMATSKSGWYTNDNFFNNYYWSGYTVDGGNGTVISNGETETFTFGVNTNSDLNFSNFHVDYQTASGTNTICQDGAFTLAVYTPTPTPTVTPTLSPTPPITPTPYPHAPANGAWTNVGNMAARRIDFTSTLLQNGKVLIAGGRPSSSETLTNFTELYDPNSRTWSTTGTLNTPRLKLELPTEFMVTLQNGKALIAGGMDANFNSIGSAELFDPTTGTWSYTGNLNTSRRDASLILLDDGRALSVGGASGSLSDRNYLSSAELYNPATGTWSFTANNLPLPRDGANMIKLPGGKVLVMGGIDLSNNCESSSEIFDPSTNSFSSGGTMPWGADGYSTAILPDGRVFTAGGNCNGQDFTNTAIYDPSTNEWTSKAPLPVTRPMTMTTLSNGKVLVRTGESENSASQPYDEIYDPATNSWSVSSAVLPFADRLTWTQLANGDLLAMGGVNCGSSYPSDPTCTLSSAELFTIPNHPPVVNAISVSINPVQVNAATSATATFSDADTSDTHTATWDWGDGNTTSGTVTESNGSGSVSDSHTYSSAGVYTVTLKVIDNQGGSGTSTFQYVSVYNPTSQGLFSAGQKYTSPAGAYTQNTSLTGDVKFGLSYKYQGTMPVSDKQFTMNFKAANLTFNAAAINSLVIANSIGTLTGTGTINGSGTYNFLVTGSESANTIRIQISDSSNNVIYDTQPGASATATPTTSVSGHVLAH